MKCPAAEIDAVVNGQGCCQKVDWIEETHAKHSLVCRIEK